MMSQEDSIGERVLAQNYILLKNIPLFIACQVRRSQYVFCQESPVHEMMPIYFLDKYGQEWKLFTSEYLEGFTYQGVPVTLLGKE